MATVTMTQEFSFLQGWPGRLLESNQTGVTITTATATTFSFVWPPGHPFEDFRITATGTGFTYDGTEPIDGTISTLRIYNASGQLILTIAGLATNPIGGDLSQFYSNVFGAGAEGPGPDGLVAWSHLLSGNDLINGTGFDDGRSLPGYNVGNDTIRMGAGDDFIYGSQGNDSIDGGDGYDLLSYSETTFNAGAGATRGLAINVTLGRLTDVWGGTDRFTNIEEFEGSRFGDLFVGHTTQVQRDRFGGLRGRDTIDGGMDSFDSLGNSTGDTRDEVRYSGDYWHGGTRGIIVDLETAFTGTSIRGTIRDGFGNLDTVIDIERVDGTRFNDVFVGSRVNNGFRGGEGIDSYDGEGGFDFIDFGRWYGDTPVGAVRVDLTRATGQIMNDGFGNVENVSEVEGFWGTINADWFRGNAADQSFAGLGGADTMTGGGGSDTFEFWGEGDLGAVDRITDFSVALDRLAFDTAFFTGMTGVLTLVNGTAATAAVGTFVYNSANRTLYWDQDGTGAAAAQAVVVFSNAVAALNASNFDLWV